MSPLHINLPLGLTAARIGVLRQYFQDERALSTDDWARVLEGMDLLRAATLTHPGGTETFAALYNRQVDAVYADGFIEQLLAMDDPAAQSEPLRAVLVRRIINDLRQAGLYDPAVRETQLLVAFCAFWWQSFTKGYAFEAETFRDLSAAGIRFVAHDLHRREERLSPYDLTVLGRCGDIKTSTYFLSVHRPEELRHDFYITRLYHPPTHGWHKVVLLQEAFWRILDDEPTPTTLEQVWQILPGVALVWLTGRPFVVVSYEVWKERVRQRQEGET
jgi:hypothetical protein